MCGERACGRELCRKGLLALLAAGLGGQRPVRGSRRRCRRGVLDVTVARAAARRLCLMVDDQLPAGACMHQAHKPRVSRTTRALQYSEDGHKQGKVYLTVCNQNRAARQSSGVRVCALQPASQSTAQRRAPAMSWPFSWRTLQRMPYCVRSTWPNSTTPDSPGAS